MMGFLLRAAISAIGLWVATRWVPGFAIDDPTSLLIAAVVLGVVNAIVRPVVVLLTIPVTIVTLGLFLLVVNAAMIGLVAALVPGFAITGFWPAVFGALVVWLISWIGSWFIGSSGLERAKRNKSS